MQQTIFVEDTNLISKINLLFAIDFLLNLSLYGQQLHGFNDCLKYQKCQSPFTVLDTLVITVILYPVSVFPNRFPQSMLLLQIGEDILGAIRPVLLIQIGEDGCCACLSEINSLTYNSFNCKHISNSFYIPALFQFIPAVKGREAG